MLRIAAVVLAGCSFSLNPSPSGTSDATPIDAAFDAATCGWTYAPSNFAPCALAATPAALVVAIPTTIDTGSLTLPHTIETQTDGTQVAVIHLVSLNVTSTLTVIGPYPAIFAVDGSVVLGKTVVLAGSDDPIRCATSAGGTGLPSGNTASGGGGGGGGGAAAAGGDGSDGDGTGRGLRGSGGAQVAAMPTVLSPMRAGCPGGRGGRRGSGEEPGAPGPGGGGLQISARGTVTITSGIDASGRGGGLSSSQGGGGGGGSGGALLLEGVIVRLGAGSVLCADGGSGAEGGGINLVGAPGAPGACNGTAGAAGGASQSYGSTGGSGGYQMTPAGQGAFTDPSNNAGGGAGGGSVGWIRIRSIQPASIDASAIVTPDPTID